MYYNIVYCMEFIAVEHYQYTVDKWDWLALLPLFVVHMDGAHSNTWKGEKT